MNPYSHSLWMLMLLFHMSLDEDLVASPVPDQNSRCYYQNPKKTRHTET